MIELERVRVDHPRGGQPLLDEATTVVQRGEVAILGASTGAGASLLLAAVLGDHPLADGKVSLFGRDLSRLRRASLLRLRRRVGVVPQDLRLLGEATALTNVLLPLDIDHVPRHAATIRAAEALGRVGLAAELDVRVDRLSMAERQRVALARALVREPAIVILDQPTSHQDPERALTIARVLSEVAAAGATVLVASRDAVLWEVAAAEGWRTLALRDGKMVETTASAVQSVIASPGFAGARSTASAVQSVIASPGFAGARSTASAVQSVIASPGFAGARSTASAVQSVIASPGFAGARSTASAVQSVIASPGFAGARSTASAVQSVIDAPSAEIVIESDVIDSEPVPALATITPISAAIAAAEAQEAVPNVVPFPITARSRGQR